MKRSKLPTRFVKKSEVSRKAYTAKSIYCVNLLWKTKTEYFVNIKINNIADNKRFWQTVKYLFSEKINRKETIDLIDIGVTLSNEEKIAEMFNNYFCNMAKSLSLPQNPFTKELSVELCNDLVNLY